ncbi:hypothetical protein L6452_34668 [Arctium lappa]|uniref:Uncharacterized protein n=1 Tax=Arctium lappa TaxID=4217 RepID=A0ACB8YJL0_ARCLA|nr:hypothetical protein L6452_34668 [Arctium lappa]
MIVPGALPLPLVDLKVQPLSLRFQRLEQLDLGDPPMVVLKQWALRQLFLAFSSSFVEVGLQGPLQWRVPLRTLVLGGCSALPPSALGLSFLLSQVFPLF